jgi:putative molybdopterin biosynthesis protein
MDRRRYLKRMSREAALRLWMGQPAAAPLPAETVSTAQAVGRVTAGPVFAARSVPHFPASAMDGLAVRAVDTFHASERRPVTLAAGSFVVVDTGDPIPEGFDAVVMIEDVRWLPEGGVALVEAASPWQHVRMAGEDLAATEMVLPRGQLIGPEAVAALLAGGVMELAVHRAPRVAVIPTGDELVEADDPRAAEAGAIPETNSHLIAGIAAGWGAEVTRWPIVEDQPRALSWVLSRAVEDADVVCVNAGSSAGRDDFAPVIIGEAGELLAHGVEIMPGKPMALGIVAGTPVLGVPGYPVSAWVVCREFLRPLLFRMRGLPEPARLEVPAVMGRATPSRAGTEEHLRVKAGRVGDRLVAVPMARGASLLSSVVRADGIIRVPAHAEGIAAGEAVMLEPLRDVGEIERQLLVVGSHDITLDVADDLLRAREGAGLSSAHVGSLGGLSALKRGECHLAGTHLLDELTGDYNLSAVKRFFPEGGVALVNLCYRMQGLIVAPGNPLGLRSIADVAELGAQFINRQSGSGTRMLLDYELRRRSIAPDRIVGYHRELYTHLAVAAAIAGGGADVGLGILAAAKALGLEFVPLAEERYDLAIRGDALASTPVRELLEVIASPEFHAAVAALGGYDLRDCGRLLLSPNAAEAAGEAAPE